MGSLSVHPGHIRKAFKHSFLLLLNALIMLMPDANKILTFMYTKIGLIYKKLFKKS